MGRESADLRSRVQALLDRKDGWGVAKLLRDEHAVALRAHVEKRLRRVGRAVDRAADVCADVWKDVEENLLRQPIAWHPDRQLAFLSKMANNKIVDLSKELDRQAVSHRTDHDREQSLLDAITGPSIVRPDRKLSGAEMRKALDTVLAAIGPEAAKLLELTALDRLDPRDIAARAEAEPELARAIALEEAVAKIAAARDPASQAHARDKLEGLVRTRLSRARKAADEVIARHALLQHYRPQRAATGKP